MKNRITVVGIGQGGGNFAQGFDDIGGYNTLAINTSLEDLKTLKVRNKLHIPDAEGCNKSRKKALGFAKNHYGLIVEHIVKAIDLNKEKNKNVKQNLLLSFSIGGGTGGGIGPIIADMISSKYKDLNVMVVCVLPNKEESLVIRENAKACIKQLYNIKNLGSIFVLDNKNLNKYKEDKFLLNKDFIERFDRLVNVSTPDERGVIDKAELQQALDTKGFGVLSYFVENELKYGSFTEVTRGSKYEVLITSSKEKELNYKDFKESFGTPMYHHSGFNSEINFVGAFGLPYPTCSLEELILETSYEVEDIKNEETNSVFEIPDSSVLDLLSSSETQEEQKEDNEFDIDNFWGDIEDNY